MYNKVIVMITQTWIFLFITASHGTPHNLLQNLMIPENPNGENQL